MKRIGVIATALFAGGCAHSPKAPPPPPFIGGPLDQVVKQMGYPQTEREFEGDKVYTWTLTYTEAHLVLFRTRTACTMDVGVHEGRVKSISYNGDRGPCGDLQGKLNDR